MTEEQRQKSRKRQLELVEQVIKNRPDLRLEETSSLLINKIKKSFSKVQYPKNEYLSGSSEHNKDCWEHQECQDFFVGKKWEECLDEDSYRKLCGGQSYFNSLAWHYFLPAYLIQCLMHKKFSSSDFGYFLEKDSETSEWWQDRIKLLNSAQNQIIIEYLELTFEFWKGVSKGYEDDARILDFWRGILKNRNFNE